MFVHLRRSILVFACLAIFACSPGNSGKKTNKNGYKNETPPAASGLSLINPNASDTTDRLSLAHLADLKDKCDSFIRQQLQQNQAESISFYFESLKSGRNFSIHPGIQYAPASLLKLSILLTFLKIEEEDPAIRYREIPVFLVAALGTKGDIDEDTSLEYTDDRAYTVDELCNNMIRYSDNSATHSLLTYLDAHHPGILENLEQDLHAAIPANASNTDNIIHAGHFAFMLRSLYKANYLRPDLSQRALEILCGSRYMQGFRKNIPSLTPIAHKFGVRYPRADHKKDFYQLHEIGIIYAENQPFVLSIMTKGNGIPQQRKVIQELSGFVYTLVSEN